MLSEYLKSATILLNAEANDYRELLSMMLDSSSIGDISGAVDKILEREKIMPTALGKGIFLPRVVLDNMKRTEIFIALNHSGLVFDDYGSAVANVIMLFLFSKNDDHVALLAQSLRLLNDDALRSDLLHCKKAADVISTIDDWEKE
jgi:mannitol/fructose-specific phosphotransferase system IIA component (Ntr-type)